MRVAVQVKVVGEAGMNKSVQPEKQGVRGGLHGLVHLVWVQRFRWWGGGTSGQRGGQRQIPEDHAGTPKNWNLKLGEKGSHCRLFKLGRSSVRFTFGCLIQAARRRAGTQKQQVTSRDEEGLKQNLS